MDWLRIVLDGVAMSAVFSAVIGMCWFIMPHAYATMFPKEIKKAAAPYTKKELLKLGLVLFPLYFGIVAWMVLSAYSGGTDGFRELFWSGYLKALFINFGDFLFLDCLLVKVIKKRCMLPGTEHCKAWEMRGWMKAAVPEHFILWPFVGCPVTGLLAAGIGVLLA